MSGSLDDATGFINKGNTTSKKTLCQRGR